MPVPVHPPRPPKVRGKLLSCRTAARMLDVSDDTIRRLAHEGKLEAIRVGQRCLRVSEVSVLALTADPAAMAEGGVQ